jgi:hypothetical protein
MLGYGRACDFEAFLVEGQAFGGPSYFFAFNGYAATE